MNKAGRDNTRRTEVNLTISFRIMDDLVVELFRRLSDRELKRLSAAGKSKHALREI